MIVRHYSTLNIPETVQDRDVVTMVTIGTYTCIVNDVILYDLELAYLAKFSTALSGERRARRAASMTAELFVTKQVFVANVPFTTSMY